MKIIFYDGYCPMCNGWVKRLVRWDKRRAFYFAPLEGEVAKEKLENIFPGYIHEDTIIFLDEEKNRIALRSTAALWISESLPFPWRLFVIGWLVPKFIRDGIYKWVASRRYTYGPRYASCPLPPLEWRERFLM